MPCTPPSSRPANIFKMERFPYVLQVRKLGREGLDQLSLIQHPTVLPLLIALHPAIVHPTTPHENRPAIVHPTAPHENRPAIIHPTTPHENRPAIVHPTAPHENRNSATIASTGDGVETPEQMLDLSTGVDMTEESDSDDCIAMFVDSAPDQ